MTDLKVAPLVTRTARDAERVGKLISDLTAEHAAGKIKELCFVYLESEGQYAYAVSGNMTFSHLSMCVTYLQIELMKLINRNEDDAAP